MFFFKKKIEDSRNDIKLMSQVISLPAIFIILLLISGVYGQFLGKRVSTSLTDIYLKVVSPLVNFQSITTGLNTLTINLLVVQNTPSNDPLYSNYLAKIKTSIIQLDQLIEDEITSAKGRPYEKVINKWEPEWEKFYLEVKDNSYNQNYLKNNMPRLLSEIDGLGHAMGSIDSVIKITISGILEDVDNYMSHATKVLTMIQLLGLFLGVLITIPIIQSIKRLMRITYESKKSMETLLNNLDQGFLVYSRDGVVFPGATKAATTLFGLNPTGLKFSEILQINSSEEKNNIENWLKILFSGQLPFSESKQWGPRAFQKSNNLFIELDYRPIMKFNTETETDELEAVICIASDKTQEKAFKKSFEQEQNRLNFIANVAIGPEIFIGFIKENRTNLIACQKEMTNVGPDIDVLFRLLHNIKGNSNALKMIEISNLAHNLESLLEHIRDGKKNFSESIDQIKNDIIYLDYSFEKYLSDNKDFIGDIDEHVQKKSVLTTELYQFELELRKNYGINSEIHKSFMSHFVLEEFSNGFKIFSKVINDLAEKLGKNVSLRINPSTIKVCLKEYTPLFASMIHIFQNAVDHGIEDEFIREQNGKSPEAKIEVAFTEVIKNNKIFIHIEVRDDGAGISAEKIRSKFLEKGILSKEDLLKKEDNEIIQNVFLPGLSTSETISEISGRGVGLDSVKNQVELLNGSVWVTTELGKWTVFNIDVPKIEQLQ